ncbi:MAG: sporulation transcription factor Spo0A [Clostridiaceae bacterium]|nr:sporulation transcription factor Spo0A [Clostridiaceae bacterium]
MRIVNEKITVYVVDDSEEYIQLVEESLSNIPNFEIIGKAYDGEAAIKGITETKPDIVLLDLVIPQKDGIAVLEELQKEEELHNSVIIMLTAIGQDKYIKKALSLGAEYYIMKPYDMNLLPKRILQVYQDSERNKKPNFRIPTAMNSQPRAIRAKERQSYTLRDYAEADVIKALRDIGVPAHLSGYGYLQKAILETVLSERGFIPITKELYPMIAESFNTTPGKVERAIRGAIQKVWQRMNPEKLAKFFTYAENRKDAHPTNSEFIATIADKIRLMYLTKY